MKPSNYEIFKSRKGLVDDEIRRVQILQDNLIEWNLTNSGDGETTHKMFHDENIFVNLMKAARAYHDALFAFRFDLFTKIREIEDSIDFRLLRGMPKQAETSEREKLAMRRRPRPTDVADAAAIAAAGMFATRENLNVPSMPENANEDHAYIHRSDAIPMMGTPLGSEGNGSEPAEARRSLSNSEIAKDCGE